MRFTYDTLVPRGGVAKSNVKLMLDFLQRAGVVRYERVPDSERGSILSVLHLLIQDVPWLGITVAMADRLATKRSHGHLLRDLGLVIVLLEFCVAQRDALAGLQAEVLRSDIARQARARRRPRRRLQPRPAGRWGAHDHPPTTEKRRATPRQPVHDPRSARGVRPGRQS